MTGENKMCLEWRLGKFTLPYFSTPWDWHSQDERENFNHNHQSPNAWLKDSINMYKNSFSLAFVIVIECSCWRFPKLFNEKCVNWAEKTFYSYGDHFHQAGWEIPMTPGVVTRPGRKFQWHPAWWPGRVGNSNDTRPGTILCHQPSLGYGIFPRIIY